MKFTNNASSTLASGITNVATSLTVASGNGALFPTLSAGDYFYCTLTNAIGTIEIVKVTARSTDTFTITRAQDGTSAAAWNTGDKVELRLVSASLNDLPKLDEVNTFSLRQTFSVGTVQGPWTTGTRPASPTAGLMGFNTTFNRLEAYNGTASAWVSSGGATGTGSDAVFYENGKTVNTSYSITSGNNAHSVGPITIASGQSVTLPTGSRWVIA